MDSCRVCVCPGCVGFFDGVDVGMVSWVGWGVSELPPPPQSAAGCVIFGGWMMFLDESMGCCHGVLCSCSWVGFLELGMVVEVRRSVSVRFVVA